MRRTLAPHDALTAGEVGLRRQIWALSVDLKHYGNDSDADASARAFDHHIWSCMSEFVVAREFNLFWKPHIGITKGCDVGGIIEVRMRNVPGSGTDLAIRPHDKPDKPHLLVLNFRNLTFDLVGWLSGDEGLARARDGCMWDEMHQCWYVPPPYRPLEELHKLVESWRSKEESNDERSDTDTRSNPSRRVG